MRVSKLIFCSLKKLKPTGLKRHLHKKRSLPSHCRGFWLYACGQVSQAAHYYQFINWLIGYTCQSQACRDSNARERNTPTHETKKNNEKDKNKRQVHCSLFFFSFLSLKKKKKKTKQIYLGIKKVKCKDTICTRRCLCAPPWCRSVCSRLDAAGKVWLWTSPILLRPNLSQSMIGPQPKTNCH